MRARQLLEGRAGSVFGPETLKIVYRAFDGAWEMIASNYGSDPDAIEAGRLQLAEAILPWCETTVKIPSKSGTWRFN